MTFLLALALIGGLSPSARDPKPIDAPVPPGVVSLIAHPRQGGFRLVLANATNQQVAFTGTDGRLPILREALDKANEWRPVEVLPRVWCGNSYHPMILPPGRAWSFTALESKGSLKTRLRFVLGTGKTAIYSNELEGWIDEEQFVKR